MSEYTGYKVLLKTLRAKLPLPFPLECKRLKMSDCLHGTCSRHRNKFVIKINRRLSEELVIETLLHEYAHALCWNYCHDQLENEDLQWHGAAWGVAYSQVYQIYEEYYIGGKTD